MKPEIKAKIFVALIVSFLAFGIGSGAGIFAGYPGTHYLPDFSLTQPGEMPMIFNQPKNNTQTIQTNPSTRNEQVYQEPATQKPSSNTGNTSNSQNNNIKPNSTSN